MAELSLALDSSLERFAFFIKQAGAIVVIGAIIVGGSLVGSEIVGPGIIPDSGGGGGDDVANIWVDTSGGSCQRSATPIVYTGSGTECGTFDAAWQLSVPGDTVRIKTATYGSQALHRDLNKDSASQHVLMIAESGTTVTGDFTFGDPGIDDGIDWLDITDVDATLDIKVRRGSTNLILRDMVADRITMSGAGPDILVDGGSFGPKISDVNLLNGCTGCPNPAHGVTFDGVLFHDFTVTDPADHAECLMLQPARDITIRNSIFQNCTDFGLFLKSGGASMSGFLFENNFFDIPMPGSVNTTACNPNCPRSGSSLRVSDGGGVIDDVTIRFNSALGSIISDSTNTNVTITKNCSTGFVDGTTTDGTMDLHITSASSCNNTGGTSGFPTTDIDGDNRPANSPDADTGADERS